VHEHLLPHGVALRLSLVASQRHAGTEPVDAPVVRPVDAPVVRRVDLQVQQRRGPAQLRQATQCSLHFHSLDRTNRDESFWDCTWFLNEKQYFVVAAAGMPPRVRTRNARRRIDPASACQPRCQVLPRPVLVLQQRFNKPVSTSTDCWILTTPFSQQSPVDGRGNRSRQNLSPAAKRPPPPRPA
jgi:hypothetical protein